MIYDMLHDSDEKDVSELHAHGSPSSQDTIPGAGRPLSNVDGYRELNQAMADGPWSLFSSEADFNFAS